jgi:hypothetical protein
MLTYAVQQSLRDEVSAGDNARDSGCRSPSAASNTERERESESERARERERERASERETRNTPALTQELIASPQSGWGSKKTAAASNQSGENERSEDVCAHMWRDASTPATGDTGDVADMGDVQVEDVDVRAGCLSSTNTKYFPPDLVASTTVAQEEETWHTSLDPHGAHAGNAQEQGGPYVSIRQHTSACGTEGGGVGVGGGGGGEMRTLRPRVELPACGSTASPARGSLAPRACHSSPQLERERVKSSQLSQRVDEMQVPSSKLGTKTVVH